MMSFRTILFPNLAGQPQNGLILHTAEDQMWLTDRKNKLTAPENKQIEHKNRTNGVKNRHTVVKMNPADIIT